MSATTLGNLFSSLFSLGVPSPVIDDSASRRLARAQERKMLTLNLSRFPGAAAQMSFRQQIARLDAEDRAEMSGAMGALGASKYGGKALRLTTKYSPSTSYSLTDNVKSSPSTSSYSLTDNVKSSPSTSSYSADSSANASEEFDLDASVTDYPAQIEELKARLRAEKNAAKRQRIMARIRQMQRALAKGRAGGARRMPRTEGAAAPRVTTEELEQKLQELIGRRDKLARRFKGAKGGKRSDLQNRIQGLSKRINDLRERIDRLDSLPPGRKGAEIRAISSGLSEGATMARTLEADPTLRYGLEAEDAADTTDASAEDTAITPAAPAADTVTADQPWYKRYAIPLTLAGASVAIVGTLLLTRKSKSRD